MIYGDPLEFAIRYDLVNEWKPNWSPWLLGFIEYYIKGEKYPKYPVIQTTFNINMNLFYEGFHRELRITRVRMVKDIFKKSKCWRFYGNTYLNEDMVLNLSTTDMEDDGVYIFYFYTRYNDYIIVWDNNKKAIFKYNRRFIYNILERLVEN